MRKPVPVPVRRVGPGSQPDDDLALACPPMPTIEIFAMPRAPAALDHGSIVGAAAIIEALHRDLAAWRARRSDPPPPLDVGALPAGALEALNDGLGQGEVSCIVHRSADRASPPRTRIQETAFAGVWRTRHYDDAGVLAADLLEAADIPPCVRATAHGSTTRGFDAGAPTQGAMTSPAVLRELAHHAASWRPGDPPHVVNLTLLPCSPADLQALDDRLGAGPLVILSRGFGDCRIASTGVRNVWRVQYFNNVQTLLLDTIEVVDVPQVALAAAEDFDDTLERLRDLLRWMHDDTDERAGERTAERTARRTATGAPTGEDT